MSDEIFEPLEGYLSEAARTFPYPPTPDIARSVRRELQARRGVRPSQRSLHRLAWVMVVVLLLFASLLAVPPVRAQILEFLQIGAIRIFLAEPTSTPAPTPLKTSAGGIAVSTPIPTPSLVATPLSSVLDLQGETSLEEAHQAVPFSIQLPAYPEDLGPPQRVFLQNMNGTVLVLVWLEPGQPEAVRLSLHMLTGKNNFSGSKVAPRVVQETTVGSQPAVWAQGPYLLTLGDGNYDVVRLIEGHVLIWEEGELTYRLETDLNLEEARRIAESLQPLAP